MIYTLNESILYKKRYSYNDIIDLTGISITEFRDLIIDIVNEYTFSLKNKIPIYVLRDYSDYPYQDLVDSDTYYKHMESYRNNQSGPTGITLTEELFFQDSIILLVENIVVRAIRYFNGLLDRFSNFTLKDKYNVTTKHGLREAILLYAFHTIVHELRHLAQFRWARNIIPDEGPKFLLYLLYENHENYLNKTIEIDAFDHGNYILNNLFENRDMYVKPENNLNIALRKCLIDYKDIDSENMKEFNNISIVKIYNKAFEMIQSGNLKREYIFTFVNNLAYNEFIHGNFDEFYNSKHTKILLMPEKQRDLLNRYPIDKYPTTNIHHRLYRRILSEQDRIVYSTLELNKIFYEVISSYKLSHLFMIEDFI